MREFPGGPKHSDAELEALREMFKKDRRPTREELENFVVTKEHWDTTLALYHRDRQWMIETAAKSRDRATSYRGFKVGAQYS